MPSAATEQGGVPPHTLGLVHLCASQINGRSSCVDSGPGTRRHRTRPRSGCSARAAWREAPCFTAAERAALALAEAMTRLSDCADPVTDEIWAEAARHYDERASRP
jgi:alkylhydroperoxidase family enzyme